MSFSGFPPRGRGRGRGGGGGGGDTGGHHLPIVGGGNRAGHDQRRGVQGSRGERSTRGDRGNPGPRGREVTLEVVPQRLKLLVSRSTRYRAMSVPCLLIN